MTTHYVWAAVSIATAAALYTLGMGRGISVGILILSWALYRVIRHLQQRKTYHRTLATVGNLLDECVQHLESGEQWDSAYEHTTDYLNHTAPTLTSLGHSDPAHIYVEKIRYQLAAVNIIVSQLGCRPGHSLQCLQRGHASTLSISRTLSVLTAGPAFTIVILCTLPILMLIVNSLSGIDALGFFTTTLAGELIVLAGITLCSLGTVISIDMITAACSALAHNHGKTS